MSEMKSIPEMKILLRFFVTMYENISVYYQLKLWLPDEEYCKYTPSVGCERLNDFGFQSINARNVYYFVFCMADAVSTPLQGQSGWSRCAFVEKLTFPYKKIDDQLAVVI